MISKTSNWFLYPIAPTHAPNDHKKSSFTAHALPVVVVEDGGTVSVVLEYDWNYSKRFSFRFSDFAWESRVARWAAKLRSVPYGLCVSYSASREGGSDQVCD